MESIWETQEMEETARNRQWEELNAEHEEEEQEFDYYGVFYALGDALEKLSKVCDSLAAAEDKADPFPVMADLELLKDDAEELFSRVTKIRDNLDKEVKTA